MAPVGWYESKGSKMSLPCCPNIIRQDVWPWPDVIGVPLETTLWNSLERTSRFPKTLSNQKKISSQSCWEGGCIPKLLLYKGAICPQVIFNLPTTWRSGEVSKLSGSKDEWKPKSTSNLTTPYRKMHVSHVCKLITLQDPVAQHVAKLQIEKENRTNREASSSQRLQYRKIMMAGIPRWEELRKQWNHSQGELQSADCKRLEPLSSGIGPQKIPCRTWFSPWSDRPICVGGLSTRCRGHHRFSSLWLHIPNLYHPNWPLTWCFVMRPLLWNWQCETGKKQTSTRIWLRQEWVTVWTQALSPSKLAAEVF